MQRVVFYGIIIDVAIGVVVEVPGALNNVRSQTKTQKNSNIGSPSIEWPANESEKIRRRGKKAEKYL